MNGSTNQRASRLGSVWAGLMAVLLLASTLVGLGASTADATDGKPKYTVSAEGITLPAGYAFEAHGHVNWKTSWAQHGVHFDPNNNQPGGAYIGKTFLPWNLEPGECVTWVQVAGWNYHFGEGGESPVCAPETETPPVDPPVDPPKPEQPAALVREKTTHVCKAASRVTDFYETPYVWSPEKKAWVLGKETWVRKTSTPLIAAECGYETVVREKVTIDCKGGVKNVVFTDFYIREWTFDAKTKTWVLGPEKWSHKVKVPATDTQCPPPVTEEPTPEPTDPTPEPTDPTPEPTEPPVTEEPTEEPTEPPLTPEPTDPPTTTPPTTEPTTPVPSEEPTWTPPTPSPSSSPSVSPPTPTSSPASSTPPVASTSVPSQTSSSSSKVSEPNSSSRPSLAKTGFETSTWILGISLATFGGICLGAAAVLRRRGDR